MGMKKTKHFIEDVLPIRPYLTDEVLAFCVSNFVKSETQNDGQIAYWGLVPSLGRYLKVVIAADGETVITGHIDRNFETRSTK